MSIVNLKLPHAYIGGTNNNNIKPIRNALFYANHYIALNTNIIFHIVYEMTKLKNEADLFWISISFV